MSNDQPLNRTYSCERESAGSHPLPLTVHPVETLPDDSSIANTVEAGPTSISNLQIQESRDGDMLYFMQAIQQDWPVNNDQRGFSRFGMNVAFVSTTETDTKIKTSRSEPCFWRSPEFCWDVSDPETDQSMIPHYDCHRVSSRMSD